jgi:hypothetical protein
MGVSIVLKPMIPSCFGGPYVGSLVIKSGNLKGFDKRPEQVYNPSLKPKAIRTQPRPRQSSECLNGMTLACLPVGEKMGNLASPFRKLFMFVARHCALVERFLLYYTFFHQRPLQPCLVREFL